MTIFIGWGARGATQEILDLAQKLKSPVIHALKGKAVIANENPYWAGGVGMLGSTCGMEAMESCELLLMLGTDFPYRQFYPKGKTIIQIDTLPEHLGKRCNVKMGVVGDVKASVTALLPMVKEKKSD
ncbi:hypothetical protein [Coxiella burnetii]|nr:hypothetical protein [Coxiella burnetii]AIT63766.1 Thiamine pyrophosphate protein TPP binding domain protein [Coxiella burnetii str. Namibia]ATN86284.1 hypothetical protein AYO29_07460 [Coxiella burnetii str. Schperling]UYK70339.1 hypothetical protein OHM78_03575 [Coxiella burnetii]